MKITVILQSKSWMFVEVSIGFDRHITAPRGISFAQSLPYLSQFSSCKHTHTHTTRAHKSHACALNAPVGEDKLWFQSHISNAWNSSGNKGLQHPVCSLQTGIGREKNVFLKRKSEWQKESDGRIILQNLFLSKEIKKIMQTAYGARVSFDVHI